MGDLWNNILQWGGVILLFVFALGFTLGWFGSKKKSGCDSCDIRDKCSKLTKDKTGKN